MSYLLTLLFGIVLGFIAGLLVFRNNKEKSEKVLTESEKEAIKLKKAGRYLLDVLKGRSDKE